jgi:hypothetical protein
MPDLPEGSTGAGQPTGADANRREEALQLARTVLSSLEAGDFEGLCVPARPDRTDDGRPSPERLKQVAQCVNWFRDSWFWAGPNLQRQSFLAFKPSPPGGEPGTIVRFTFDGKFPVEMVLEYSGVTGRQELVIASLCAKVPDPETWQQLVPGAPLPPPPCLSVKSQ